MARQTIEKRESFAVLLPFDECSPMKMDKHRSIDRMGAMAIDIKQILGASIAITNVGHSFDIPTPPKKRPEQGSDPKFGAQAHKRSGANCVTPVHAKPIL